MEERIQRAATSYSNDSYASGLPGRASAATKAGRRFESPTALEISLCCEISAYAPDGDDRPLF